MDAARTTIVLDSRLDELDRLAEAINRFCAAAALPDEAPAFALCAEELFTNAVVHGCAGKPGHPIEVTLRRAGGGLEISIVDAGPAFDPTVPTTPDLTGSIGERPIGGLGRHLVSTLMQQFCYRRQDGRNHVTFGRAPARLEER